MALDTSRLFIQKNMKLLDPTIIRDLVDYSFGDQSSNVHNLWDGYMNKANSTNQDFLSKCEIFKNNKSVMTLFIDNIRLYKREGIKYTKIELSNESSKQYKDNRVKELGDQDLLFLCSTIPDVKFIIFTGFEDTQIDDEIFDKIPENVLAVYASNSISHGGKVIPIPYGIQRKLNPYDMRQDILSNNINSKINPEKLLYINHNVNTNPERISINERFINESWVTTETPKSSNPNDYQNYLNQIKNHKFMICPDGNAIGCECHRDWEVIYMRRVPIVKDSPYLRKIFEGIPVLFVNSFLDVSEELLLNNNDLYESMQTFDLDRLDFNKIYFDILKKFSV